MVSPEAKAREVLNTYWNGLLPVDVKAIAEASGFTVIDDQPLGKTKDGVKISGEIDPQEMLIKVSSDEPRVRKRFTLAHELGHYFMGHGSRKRTDTFHRSKLSYSEKLAEWQADSFAAELLMPQHVISALIKELENPSIEEMAKILDVSVTAMNIKLSNLWNRMV